MMLELLHVPYLQFVDNMTKQRTSGFHVKSVIRPLHVAAAAVITRNAILLQFKLSLLTNK